MFFLILIVYYDSKVWKNNTIIGFIKIRLLLINIV